VTRRARSTRADRRRESGQAAVEFAIVIPVMLVAVLGIVQVGLALRNELAVQLAAREGARAASVTTDSAAAARDAAARSVHLPVDIETAVGDGQVTVTATYVDDTDVAIIGAFIGPVTHTASVTMTMEPP
jgi:Flp pilus assembly protein TadG